MIPDRQAETRAPTVADQIPLANVIRLERDEDACLWVARIGPRGEGIEASGATPEGSLLRLAGKLDAQGWWFDSGWKDRME
jgi:hypothetical protein